MKNKLLLVALLIVFAQVGANAVVSVEETTSTEYMKNWGYSGVTSDIVQVSKNRSVGEEFYLDDELRYRNKGNKFVKFCKRFWAYFDPAAEDYSFYHHDTKATPSVTDL